MYIDIYESHTAHMGKEIPTSSTHIYIPCTIHVQFHARYGDYTQERMTEYQLTSSKKKEETKYKFAQRKDDAMRLRDITKAFRKSFSNLCDLLASWLFLE